MSKINKLICFDFDDTLCHTLTPEEGKPIWLEKTGSPYPHGGWWGKKESLDTEIFDIKLNPWVYDKYLNAISDSDNYVFMATGRIVKLRNEVQKILDMHNLSFDSIHLNHTNDTFTFKCELFEKMIKRMRPEEFIMYDDREEHLVKFVHWARTIDCKVSIVDVKNHTINRNFKIKK